MGLILCALVKVSHFLEEGPLDKQNLELWG